MMSTIPPTPPRSPTIPEPYVDDLLELWSESRQSSSKRDISFHSALSHLDIDYDSDQQSDGAMYSIDSSTSTDTNDEFLLQQLISYTGLQYTFEDSPPPTNPPSPPDHLESDPETITSNSSTTNSIDFQIDHQLHHHLLHNNNNNNIKVEPGEEDGVLEEEEQSGDLLFNINNHIFSNDHSDDNEMNHKNHHHHNHHHNNKNNSSSNHHHHNPQQDDNDTDAELEEFNRYPKTEPITEEFTSHIYDSFFNMFTDDHEDPTNTNSTDSHCSLDHEPLRIKVENDITEIKHDCMWAGSCESDHHDMYDEIFGSSSFTQFDFNKYDDEDSIHHLRLLTPDLEEDEEDVEIEEEYDEEEEEDRLRGEEDDVEEMEQQVEYEDEDYYTRAPLNSIALSDHSYAFNGIGPIQQHSPLSLSAQALQLSSAQQQSFSSSHHHHNNSTHAIQGIVIKEEISEESATKKTKILVPLKDLMETLQQKSFLVAPLGPGKKVIRLTGNGETVKKVLDFKGAQFKSTSMSASSFVTSSSASNLLSSSSSTLLSGSSSLSGKLMNRNNTINNNNNINNKPPSKKMKKAIHKPKQELAPSSPVHNSLSSISSSSSSSHSSSNSSNSSNSNNNGKPKKAKTHNNMERMRRIDLRNSFDTLKKLVPPLNKAAKCSKVEILKRASEYINALKSVEKRLLREEHNLRVKNEHLRNRAALLTSSN